MARRPSAGPRTQRRAPALHRSSLLFMRCSRTGESGVTLGTMVGVWLWERHARWWQAGFTDGADAEYEEQILPLVEQNLRGARRVLDVGCGEGQVSRRIANLGVEVVGLDPAEAQVRAAHERGGRARFIRALSESIPSPDASFDVVVLCLALEHVDPFEPAIDEVARVLAPGGRFLLLLAHPLLQSPGSGWVEDQDSGDHFWRVGAYLEDDVAIDEIAPGVELQFAHRPLSRYVHAMGRAGLVIEDMVEPPPCPALLEQVDGVSNAQTIPRLMLLCARRRRCPEVSGTDRPGFTGS
jgi:SAM-dependent methyltransferase